MEAATKTAEGTRLYFRRKREVLAISQAELARRLGVSRAAVCFWESGKVLPEADTLYRLAQALGCTIDALFDPATEPVPELEGGST